MRAALLSEFRKFFSTRMWWILLICMAGYMAFLAATLGFMPALSELDPEQQAQAVPPEVLARSIYGVSATFGYLFPVMVGALAVTTEFRHQTITPTLLAEPRRSVVLLAKFLASIPMGLLYGLVGTLSSVAMGALALTISDNGAFLGEPEMTRTIALSVLAGVLWALVGVGLGAMLPNQVVAIVLLLIFTQFVEPIIRVVGVMVEGADAVVQFFPSAAGDALIGASIFTSISPAGGGGGTALLAWWQGGLLLIGYAIVFGVVGRLTTFRKDIT